MYDFFVRCEEEEELKKLGFRGACLIKKFPNYASYLNERAKLSDFFLLGVEIEAETIRELQKKALEFKNAEFTVLDNPNPEVFRAAVEKGLIDGIANIEKQKGHESMHHRRSMLDSQAGMFAAARKVSIVFNFESLLNSKGSERALYLGRMKQNMFLCVKKKVPFMIASGATSKAELRNTKVLRALGEILGLGPDQAKNALKYVQERIRERKTNV